MRPAFQSVVAQLQHERETQKYKYSYVYSVSGAVENGKTTPINITIQEDADFVCKYLTISAYGPTNSSGVRQTASNSDFLLAGITAGYADRGLQVKITDIGSSRDLTNGYVNLELMGAPGYGVQMHMPFPYSTTFKARSQIKFDFKNRDSVASLYHFVSIAMVGFKYAVGDKVGSSK